MYDYHQDFFDALCEQIDQSSSDNSVETIGEISRNEARQPHIAVFTKSSRIPFLGTTVGLANRTPLPVAKGFQYFELCAISEIDSPGILRLLSDIGLVMLAEMFPLLFGTSEQARNSMKATLTGNPANVEYHPYETVLFSGDNERMMLVPRWAIQVPQGPLVEMVEPLPITTEWSTIKALSYQERSHWVEKLGNDSRKLWTELMNQPLWSKDKRWWKRW